MIGVEIALRAVGAFYVLAGVVGTRMLTMDYLMDQMLAGISLKPVPAQDRLRRWLLGCSLLAIGMGGMALMVLSPWSVPLFLLGSATQAFYLVWARRAFPPENHDDRRGRSQTTNAALLYFGSTLLVCLAAGTGQLRSWVEPWGLAIPLAGIAMLALVGRHFFWRARRADSSWHDEDLPPREIPPPPERVRLAPSWGGYPLRDVDNGEGVIYDDYLPRELADRLYDWTLAFHAGDDHEVKEFWAQFDDEAAEATHRAEGHAIVAALGQFFAHAEGPTYPTDIRYGPINPET